MVKTLPKRKTKILATLGPASSSREIIAKLIEANANAFRLNFSHGTHEQHAETLRFVREEAQRLDKPIAVMQDLSGPKIRIGLLKKGSIELKEGEHIDLTADNGKPGDKSVIKVKAFNPIEVIEPGEKVLLADGKVVLVAEEITATAVQCKIEVGGAVRSRTGISVPDSNFSLPCLTEKDYEDVRWGVKNQVDYIALSFVGQAKDILTLRSFLETLGSRTPIIAKVERRSAMNFINEIVGVSKAVMVARGDLGIELPLEQVPGAQRLIIEASNHHGIPVITATEMLRSMVTEIRPTRAEVSDVTTAVRDGTDVVMLSEETAIGKYPVESVKMLDSIVRQAEEEYSVDFYEHRRKALDQGSVADAICFAGTGASEKISAAAILACTESGYTSRLMAKYRPHQPLFGATTQPGAYRRMALYWGVEPVLMSVAGEQITETEINAAMATVRDQYGLKPGSRVVITAGLRSKESGTTNLMEIREIPRP